MNNKTVRFFIILFLGIFGVHKFLDRQYGMGLLYLFTGGFFGFGWLIDLFRAGREAGFPLLKWLSILCVWPIALAVWFYRTDKVHLDKNARLGVIATIFAGCLLVSALSPSTESLRATPTPTAAVTAAPTETPTPAPTATPSPSPTAEPTPTPTATPTAEPTPTPTIIPTATPTPEPTMVPTPEPTKVPTPKPTKEPSTKPVPPIDSPDGNQEMVWIPTHGGKKYHSNPSCSNMKNPQEIPLEKAKDLGFTACKRCH